jgi:hypothetical protein
VSTAAIDEFADENDLLGGRIKRRTGKWAATAYV